MFRSLFALVFIALLASIDKVKRGKDPLGVIRDPACNRLISFNTITDSKREVGKGR